MSLSKKYLKSKQVCKVTFSLPKEAVYGGTDVRLLGEFNNWEWEKGIKMKAQKAAFKATLELETGKAYQFRYLIDNAQWENDWEAEAYYPTPFGVDNSVVFVDEVLDVPVKSKTKRTTKQTAAKTSEKDNLKKIEGIGPKIEKLLNEAGVNTFSDLSKAKLALLKEVLANAGNRFKMHDPKTWSKQAKLADMGDWEKLQTLQEQLKGGKVK